MAFLMVFESLNRAFLQATSFIYPRGTIKRIIYRKVKSNFHRNSQQMHYSITNNIFYVDAESL